MKYKNIKLIYDNDHGDAHNGWYARFDRYTDGGELDQSAIDYPLESFAEADALKETVDLLECDVDDIKVIY